MSKYAQYFAIERRISRTGYKVTRTELIEEFTSGRKSGLKELTPFEYAEFIRHLQSKLNQTSVKPWEGTPEDRMRKKLIQLFVHEMNYTLDELNQWCINYGKFHKPLNAHTYTELQVILSIGQNKVYKQFMQKINHNDETKVQP